MDDKNFSKLKLKIEQRALELHELQKLHTIATGQSHLAGRLNPFCPECNEPMRHVCIGTWECKKCKKDRSNVYKIYRSYDFFSLPI